MLLVHSLVHPFKNQLQNKVSEALVLGLPLSSALTRGPCPHLPSLLSCPPRNLAPRILSVQVRPSGSSLEPLGFGQQQVEPEKTQWVFWAWPEKVEENAPWVIQK